MMKFTQLNFESLFTGEIIGSKFIKSLNMSMTLCHQKETKQGKMSWFLTRLIKNSAFAILSRYENFASTIRLQLQFQQSFLYYVK